jgi:DNA replication protein DnaC
MKKMPLDEILKQDLNQLNQDLEIEYGKLIANPVFKQVIQDLKLTEEEIRYNLSTFLLFNSPENNPQHCTTSSNCIANKHHLLKVYRDDNGSIYRTQEPCPLYQASLDLETYLQMSDFSTGWDLKPYALDLKFERRERKEIEERFASILQNTSKRWLYLTGSFLSEKSPMMASFALLLAQNKRYVSFMNAPKRINELMTASIENKVHFEKTFQQLIEVDVLIVDELGNEFKSEFVRDRIVYPLFLERAKSKKITCLISDFELQDWIKMYKIGTSGDLKAKQLGSLFTEMVGKTMTLSGLSGQL